MRKAHPPQKMHGNRGYKDGHKKPSNRSNVTRAEHAPRAMKQVDQHDRDVKRRGGKGFGKRLEGKAL